MSSLSSAKTLGGVGAILMLVSGFLFFTGFIGPIISIVGLILVYIGVKNISEVVNNPKIKSDFIISIVLSIIASAFIIIAPLLFLAGIAGGFTSVFTDPMNATTAAGSLLALCIIIIIVWIIFYILSAIYFKKSFDGIAQGTRTDMFRTAGLVYLIGAILIFIGIGFIILFIAQILIVVAFFSLPDQIQPMHQGGYGQPQQPYGAPPPQYYQPPQQQQYTPPPPPPQQQYTPPPPPPQQQAPPPQQTGRFCSNCGKPIPQDAQVCPYCGKDYRQQ